LVASVEAQLREAGRESSPRGALALVLAETLAAGGHTASGAAALARELQATLDAALAGAPRSGDALDEIGRRRAQKAAGA
jgi:hypothetical protein